MTMLTRHVPQRRRSNLAATLESFVAFLIPASLGIAMVVILVASLIGQVVDPPSRIQPMLDQLGRDVQVEQLRIVEDGTCARVEAVR